MSVSLTLVLSRLLFEPTSDWRKTNKGSACVDKVVETKLSIQYINRILHELLQQNAKKLFCLVSTIIYYKKFTNIKHFSFVPPPGCFLNLLPTGNNIQ